MDSSSLGSMVRPSFRCTLYAVAYHSGTKYLLREQAESPCLRAELFKTHNHEDSVHMVTQE